VYGCLRSPVLVQSEIEHQEGRGERKRRDRPYLLPKRLKKVGEEVEEGSRRMRRTRDRKVQCDGRERNAQR
jgi:hypothetical protein